MSGHGYNGVTNRLASDSVDARIANERDDIWGEMPGRIDSFDSTRQTGNIQPIGKRLLAGVPTALPMLVDVPVRFTRAGGGSVTYPVAAGDMVTLRPQMRSSEAYHTDGDDTEIEGTSFGLSSMEAFLDGGESLTDPIPNFDPANLHIRANATGTYGMRMSAQGKVAIEGAEGNIYTIIAEFMELVASDELLIKYGSSAGTGHQLFNRAPLMALAAKIRAMAL